MIESGAMKLQRHSLMFVTLLFYIASALSPHKYLLLIVLAAYVYFIFKKFNSFAYALIAAYIASIPLQAGKVFPFELLSARELDMLGITYGINADLMVTVSDVVLFLMTAFMLLDRKKRPALPKKYTPLGVVLLIYTLLMLFVTLFGSVRPEISFFHAVFSLRPLIVYCFVLLYPGFPFSGLVDILSGWLFLEGVVVAGQMGKHGALGTVIERSEYIVLDASRDSSGLFRYGGTYAYANDLAHTLIAPISLLSVALFVRTNVWYIRALVVGLCSFVVTMSRSAWVSLSAALGVFIFVHKRYVARIRISSLAYQMFILAGVAVVSVFVAMRIADTRNSTKIYGSLETRVRLLNEYTQLIRMHPWMGVGLEMDVVTQYQRSQQFQRPEEDAANRSAVLYFPQPVHNGWIRVIVQTGFVGFVGFFGAFITLLYTIFLALRSEKARVRYLYGGAIIAGMIATASNSMMQPLVPDLTIWTMISMLYLTSHS